MSLATLSAPGIRERPLVLFRLFQRAHSGIADRRSGARLRHISQGLRQDDEGEVYVLGDSNGPSGGGVVYKIVPIPADPAILNLSTRLKVETGDNVLIGGFIVTGSDTEEVVLRGIGPSLQVNGVPLAGSLPNPKIELHDSTGALIASNDNWMDSPQKDEIMSLGLAPTNPLESALFATLPPGNYTDNPERREQRHRHRAGGTLRDQFLRAG